MVPDPLIKRLYSDYPMYIQFVNIRLAPHAPAIIRRRWRDEPKLQLVLLPEFVQLVVQLTAVTLVLLLSLTSR